MNKVNPFRMTGRGLLILGRKPVTPARSGCETRTCIYAVCFDMIGTEICGQWRQLSVPRVSKEEKGETRNEKARRTDIVHYSQPVI